MILMTWTLIPSQETVILTTGKYLTWSFETQSFSMKPGCERDVQQSCPGSPFFLYPQEHNLSIRTRYILLHSYRIHEFTTRAVRDWLRLIYCNIDGQGFHVDIASQQFFLENSVQGGKVQPYVKQQPERQGQTPTLITTCPTLWEKWEFLQRGFKSHRYVTTSIRYLPRQTDMSYSS